VANNSQGRAIGGNTSISAGSANAVNNTATAGQIIISCANAQVVLANGGNSQGGNITLLAGGATSLTSGNATAGIISLSVGRANGVSGNTAGGIKIGSEASSGNTIGNCAYVDIGQANTAITMYGNVTANKELIVTGNVAVTGNITAANLGNISSLNTDGNASNILYGNGVFAQLQGDAGNLSNITGANVTGNVPSADVANVANLVVVSNANAGTSGTFYPIFVSNTGNGALQLDNVGSTITYNPSTSTLTFGTADVERTGNGLGSENIDYDGTNNSIRMSVTGAANALTLSNTAATFTVPLVYTRTYGSFTSNLTQTSAGANSTNYMTLNNTEDANGVSIVSNSQITVARTGTYNIQFSAQFEHDTNQTANLEIWLTKNGNAVANTNTVTTLIKDQRYVAAWNFVDTANTANTYYELAWASSDTSIELVAVAAGNTIANVAIPSLIVTVVPVGA
jgi:hypothetical protein